VADLKLASSLTHLHTAACPRQSVPASVIRDFEKKKLSCDSIDAYVIPVTHLGEGKLKNVSQLTNLKIFQTHQYIEQVSLACFNGTKVAYAKMKPSPVDPIEERRVLFKHGVDVTKKFQVLTDLANHHLSFHVKLRDITSTLKAWLAYEVAVFYQKEKQWSWTLERLGH